MAKRSISSCMDEDDPLSPDTLQYQANYQEEDDRIDYKLTFHPGEDRE